MDRIINWLFDDIQCVTIPQRTLYRHLIKESFAIEAPTTIVNP